MTLLIRPALLFGSVDGVGGCRRPVVSVGVGLPCSSSIVLGLSLRVKRLAFALAFIGVAMSSGLPCSSATSLPSVSADRGGLRYATDGLLLSRDTTAAVPSAGREAAAREAASTAPAGPYRRYMAGQKKKKSVFGDGRSQSSTTIYSYD